MLGLGIGLTSPASLGTPAEGEISETRKEEDGTTTRIQEDGATRVTEGT